MNKKIFTVISTFAGCGGSSLGYKMAGFKELLALEWDNNAEYTFKANFPKIPFLNIDITKVTSKKILNFCNIKKGQLDILDGSPPCQGFSFTGRRNISDLRNNLFKSYIKLIKGLKPKVFVMENVPGMALGKMKGIYYEIMYMLESIGYKVYCKQINAMYYNVPQSRKRLIFIGIRNKKIKIKIKNVFPIPKQNIINSYNALKNVKNKKDELKWAKDKIKNKKITGLISMVKEGTYGSKYNSKGHHFSLYRLHRLKPACTIVKLVRPDGGILHFNGDRFLTISEVKRLFSFPDTFKVIGTFKEQWAQLGNSVPPLMMKAIAENIKINILNKIN